MDGTTTLRSWADVDLALRELGEHEIRIERVNAKATAEMNATKEAAEKAVRPLEEQKTRLEGELERFCKGHREDFQGKRSRRLNYGTVGWRKSAKVQVPDPDALLAELKRRGLRRLINVTEKVNKEELKRQPVGLLQELGVGVVQGDAFTAKADRARIEVPEG